MGSETPGNNPAGNVDRAKMKRVLIGVLIAAAIGATVVVFAVVSNGGHRMSDGSYGGADDPDLKTIADGVQYRDVREGTGAECPPEAAVTVNFTGWLTDGVEFDASRKHNRGPVEFDLKSIIAGWKEGIPGMKVGGIRKLVIAPEKGYGSNAKERIPANSTVIFEVELVGFTPAPRRRSPIPTDLSKLSDGTIPNAADPNLKPLGDRGLKYRDLKIGDGAVVEPGAYVLADYIGWLHEDNTRFDSSFATGQPFTGILGKSIPGWQQGIVGMKVGGIRKLVIPPELAYGKSGMPPAHIPADATLVFEVEMLQTKPAQ